MATNIIVCMDKNGLIGKDNSIPWNIKEDTKYFRETTLISCVVMGRKTHESIPKELDMRANFIISRNIDYYPNWGVKVNLVQFMQWSEYYKKAFGWDTFVIGGAEIYKIFYPLADKLFITYVNDIYEGDTYFPVKFSQINEDFEIESRKIIDKCEFIVMRRKNEEN